MCDKTLTLTLDDIEKAATTFKIAKDLWDKGRVDTSDHLDEELLYRQASSQFCNSIILMRELLIEKGLLIGEYSKTGKSLKVKWNYPSISFQVSSKNTAPINQNIPHTHVDQLFRNALNEPLTPSSSSSMTTTLTAKPNLIRNPNPDADPESLGMDANDSFSETHAEMEADTDADTDAESEADTEAYGYADIHNDDTISMTTVALDNNTKTQEFLKLWRMIQRVSEDRQMALQPPYQRISVLELLGLPSLSMTEEGKFSTRQVMERRSIGGSLSSMLRRDL